MNSLERLSVLKDSVIVNGLDNYPKGEVNIIVANHTCLKDIFYLPSSLPDCVINMISARLLFKNDGKRKDIINYYLNALPIEAHGGSYYANLCLEAGVKALKEGIPITIFPEGAYVNDGLIHAGRTGALRMAFKVMNLGIHVNIVPVAINYDNEIDDLDSYDLGNDSVNVTFLKPVDIKDAYYSYNNASSLDERRDIMHMYLDETMGDIASYLKRGYSGEYITLYPKGNVMFSDGEKVDTDLAQAECYKKDYQNTLFKYTDDLVQKLVRERKF